MIKKLLSIIGETVREARARKTLIGFFIFSTIMIVVALLIFQKDSIQQNAHKLASDAISNKGKNGKVTMDLMAATVIEYVWSIISEMIFFMTICIGIFSTAGLITSIMEKGTIDLLLSKPVPRWLYVVGRYLGALTIIVFEVTYFVLGLWIVTGISFGTWSPAFLLTIIYISIGFAGIFAVTVLIGTMSRSSWLAIILGITIYFVTGIILPFGKWLDKLINGSDSTGVFTVIADIVHWTIPQMNDIASNMGEVILGKPMLFTPLLVTLGLSAAYLALSSWSFSRKEF